MAGPVTNWRCLCGSTSAYGAQRACVSCHKFFHVSCLGNVYPYTRRDLCFVCIATRQDPFHEVRLQLVDLPRAKEAGFHVCLCPFTPHLSLPGC